MLNKLNLIQDFLINMGWRYTTFRLKYALESKTGIHKKKTPISPSFKSFISLAEWRENTPPFFFQGKEGITLDKKTLPALQKRVKAMHKGDFIFFGKQTFSLGADYDWITNPETGYTYDIHKHWSEIEDLSKENGDIKFVWEKARFAFIYDVIRYDYHYQDDQAGFIFGQIEDFIAKNPINQGPNYRCSQEISLRILNWTYALYFYKNSPALNEALFSKIINSIYWQLHHVYQNIHFSRIAVRNNHAITETLMLYLSGKLFPFMEGTEQWSKEGKNWFEAEIDYQIYDDGTFLQYSMNYHRVVIQLLTWGLRLCELNGDRFRESVYIKSKKSLHFLESCLDTFSGRLPNYGSNDGALFFKLTEDDFRVYTSQLSDLKAVLDQKVYWPSESQSWYGLTTLSEIPFSQLKTASFENGGYYILNESYSKTFLRCGAYKDRPAQADNLHLDLWYKGVNYLWDNGSYKYNTTPELLRHFMGTSGHNTVTIGDHDQMLKGSRFIWYYWIKKAKAKLEKTNLGHRIQATMQGYRQLGGITHKREVFKKNSALEWEISDVVDNNKGYDLIQNWYINPDVIAKISLSCYDDANQPLPIHTEDAWHSSYYGEKVLTKRLYFKTNGRTFKTTITLVD